MALLVGDDAGDDNSSSSSFISILQNPNGFFKISSNFLQFGEVSEQTKRCSTMIISNLALSEVDIEDEDDPLLAGAKDRCISSEASSGDPVDTSLAEENMDFMLLQKSDAILGLG